MAIKYIGDILYDEHLFNNDIKIVIFGTGTYGKNILKYLEQKFVKNSVICFCDSNSVSVNVDIKGIPVWKPEDVFHKFPNADYLVSGKYSREMYDLLKQNSINNIHILVK